MQVHGCRDRDPVVAPEVANLAFHATLLVAFTGSTELARVTPVRPKGDEPAGFFTPLPAQNLLYRRTEIVISQPVEDPVVVSEGQFVRLQKCLLRGVNKSAVKSRAAGHTPHRKDLQFRSFAGQICESLVPIHLRLAAPVVTLRNEGLMNRNAEGDLPQMDILPNRSLTDSALRHLGPDPLPDPMCSVALLSRRLLVRLQNLIHKRDRRTHLPAWPLHFLARRGQCTANRLSHHSSMHAQLLCDPGNRANAELVFPADLLEQLHL